MLLIDARTLESPQDLQLFAAQFSEKWKNSIRTRLERTRSPVDVSGPDGKTQSWNLPGQTATATPCVWLYVEGNAILDPANPSIPANSEAPTGIRSDSGDHGKASPPEKFAKAIAQLCERSGIAVSEETMSNIFALPDLGVSRHISESMEETGVSGYDIEIQSPTNRVAFNFSAGNQPGRLAVTVNHEGPVGVIAPVLIGGSDRENSHHAFEVKAEFDPGDINSLQITSLEYLTRIPDTVKFTEALVAAKENKAQKMQAELES